MKILVTGGAGYIGSHTARLLLNNGDKVVILDNLENGYESAVPQGARFVMGSTHDKDLLIKLLRDESIEAVIHFAAYKAAGESVRNPGKYFFNNTAGTLSLLQAMTACDVRQLVFSSTAAVYGNPKKLPAHERLPIQPENPYGESKAIAERMIHWFDKSHNIKTVILRYFNVAGAWPDGSLGEDPSKVECLIPLVLQTASGKRAKLNIFGTDYPTPDGTAIRDFIHVLDLAEGHISALKYLNSDPTTQVVNLGTGQGVSVQTVVNEAENVTGIKIPVNTTDRRVGDPTEVWADNKKAKKLLHWQPKFGLPEIIESTWRWQQTHPEGFSR